MDGNLTICKLSIWLVVNYLVLKNKASLHNHLIDFEALGHNYNMYFVL